MDNIFHFRVYHICLFDNGINHVSTLHLYIWSPFNNWVSWRTCLVAMWKNDLSCELPDSAQSLWLLFLDSSASSDGKGQLTGPKTWTWLTEVHEVIRVSFSLRFFVCLLRTELNWLVISGNLIELNWTELIWKRVFFWRAAGPRKEIYTRSWDWWKWTELSP